MRQINQLVTTVLNENHPKQVFKRYLLLKENNVNKSGRDLQSLWQGWLNFIDWQKNFIAKKWGLKPNHKTNLTLSAY